MNGVTTIQYYLVKQSAIKQLAINLAKYLHSPGVCTNQLCPVYWNEWNTNTLINVTTKQVLTK